VSGWLTPPLGTGAPGPIVGWVTPIEPEGLGVRESAREGWRLVRAHLGTFAAVTAVPMVVLNLMILPIWISTGRMFEQMLTFWTTLDLSRYRDDPEALSRDMEAAIRPSTDLAVLSVVGTGAAAVVSIIGVAAISAAAIEAASGRRPSFAGAYRAVASHLGAIVLPAVILGLGYVAVFTPISLNQDVIMYGGDTSTARAGLSVILSFSALILELVALYLAVRWSLYLQVVLDEDLGFRAALSRTADLTKGVRIKIGLIGIVWSILIGVVVGLVTVTLAFVVGIAAASVIAGLMAYTVAISICGLIYLPFFVGVLTHIYRRRIDDLGPAAAVGDQASPPDSPDAPATSV
jgi:hypothetical protein